MNNEQSTINNQQSTNDSTILNGLLKNNKESR